MVDPQKLKSVNNLQTVMNSSENHIRRKKH